MSQSVKLIERSNNILPTKLSRRKRVVMKPRYDQTVIKLLAKKLKNHVFPRKGFRKPRDIDVELTSFEKEYEYYLVTRGKYIVDHCKSLIYELEVEKDAKKVFLLNETLKPEPYSATNSDKYSTIKLTGVASFHYEDEVHCIIDKRGREINPKELDYILREEWPKEKLNKSGFRKNISNVKITPKEEINLLKTKLINRPQNIGEVIREILEINERKIIYVPMYQLSFRNKKTAEEAIIKINGITGKIILITSYNKVLPIILIEEVNRKSHKIIKPVTPKPDETSQKSKFNKAVSTVESESKKEKIKKSEDLKPTKISPETRPTLTKRKNEITYERSEIKIDKENLEFPAKVSGDIFYVGNKITAIVGDIDIPSGTVVNDTLVVKGDLKIGKKCRILATIKALGNIMIGADTIIKGNVISSQKVSIGPRVKILGEVIIKKSLSSKSLLNSEITNE